MERKKAKGKWILFSTLFLTLILFVATWGNRLSKKELYIREVNKAVNGVKENLLGELNEEMIKSLPREALSVDVAWYSSFITERFGYRRSYKEMLDMIIAGAEGMPGFSEPTYISAIPLIYVRLYNVNGKFYAIADDRNITAYLLDEDRHIIGYIELTYSRFGKVLPTALVRGSGMLESGITKERKDEEYIFLQNGNKTLLLNAKDQAYWPYVGSELKIGKGCYRALNCNNLSVSYNEICKNALTINWQQRRRQK